ncbi:MAG: hypothetical protein KAG66_16850, partial [Methylococcales bacterium]|nr:hypothetical protein [Methylococcales bacterium]
ARQSAELLADSLARDVRVTAISGISPNDSVEKFARERLQAESSLLVVGHLPFMNKLVTLLVTGSTESIVDFQPGSTVCLSSEEAGVWQVQWMVRPALLL